jgi:hypothetical protein
MRTAPQQLVVKSNTFRLCCRQFFTADTGMLRLGE